MNNKLPTIISRASFTNLHRVVNLYIFCGRSVKIQIDSKTVQFYSNDDNTLTLATINISEPQREIVRSNSCVFVRLEGNVDVETCLENVYLAMLDTRGFDVSTSN